MAVCIPARDEETTVGAIVRTVRTELMERIPVVDELVVVDDGSRDATAAVAEKNGALVLAAASGGDGAVAGGKGRAMRQAVEGTSADVVVFCDADLASFGPHFVTGLAGPLLADERLLLVKPRYTRSYRGIPGEGGRVTELVARPLIAALFPELASVSQPLAGETGVRRDVLDRVHLENGYGVEAALLVDVASIGGHKAVAECDLGVREHRNRPLSELAPQASEVMQALMARSRATASGAPGAPVRS